MIDPNYRIIQIVDIPPHLNHERLGFHTCSWGRCKQAPVYVVWGDTLQWGRLRTRSQYLCAAHGARWCKTHHVALASVSTVPFWHERHPEKPTPYWDTAELPVLHVLS